MEPRGSDVVSNATMRATRRNHAHRIQVELRWGDVLLAAEHVGSDEAIAPALARRCNATVPETLRGARAVLKHDSTLELLGISASIIERDDDGRLVARAGDVALLVSLVLDEPTPQKPFRPGMLTAAVIGSLLLHAVMTGWMLRLANTSDRHDEEGRQRIVRALASRAHVAPPRVAPSTSARLPAAFELDAPIEAAIATVLPSRLSLRAPDDPAWRGVLAAAGTPEQMRRLAERGRAAFAELGRGPLPRAQDPDRAEAFPGLGRVGTGAGAGCSDPEQCRTVAMEPIRVRVDRARAQRLARQPMIARESAAPDPQAAPPALGELTPEYVQRRIRHDLLADVVRCYSDRAAQTSLPGGTVIVRFGIRPDGAIQSPVIARSDVHDDETHRCIERRLAAFHFPASQGSANVSYRFVFSPFEPEP